MFVVYAEPFWIDLLILIHLFVYSLVFTFYLFVYVQSRYLGSIGGKDIPETTRCIMHNLMTNALAVQLNFDGRGKKVGFADLIY